MLRGLIVLLSVVILATYGHAQCLVRRPITVGSPFVTAPVLARQYVQPVVKTVNPVVAVHHNEVVLVPKAVQVVVSPDYYFTVGDAYRDALLADAIAYRILYAQGKVDAPPGNTVPRYSDGKSAPVASAKGSGRTEAPIKTAVPDGLVALFTKSCIKCHAGVGPTGANGIGLDDPSVISEGARWKTYGLVNSGEMPKGGEPVKDDDVKLVYDWAKLAKK